MPNWQHIETDLLRVLTRDSSYWRLLKETHNPDGVKLQVQKMIERARGRPESPPFRDPVKVDELNAAQGPFYRGTSLRSGPYGHWWIEEKSMQQWAGASANLPRAQYQQKVLEFVEARMAVDKNWSYDRRNLKNGVVRDGVLEIVKLVLPPGKRLPVISGPAGHQQYASGEHPHATPLSNVVWIGGGQQIFVALTALDESHWVEPVPRSSSHWPFS
jgi:hypothetical protein